MARDEDVSNERWEGRQWTTLHYTPSNSLLATHTAIARHIIDSPCFLYLLDTQPSPHPLTRATTRLLAALAVVLDTTRASESQIDDAKQQTVTVADSHIATATPVVVRLLISLAQSDRFDDQHAAISAIHCIVRACELSKDVLFDIRESVLCTVHHGGSVHVSIRAAALLTVMRQRDGAWECDSRERQALAVALERWTVRAEEQQAEEDMTDPSDEFVMLSKLRQTLQQLMDATVAATTR